MCAAVAAVNREVADGADVVFTDIVRCGHTKTGPDRRRNREVEAASLQRHVQWFNETVAAVSALVERVGWSLQ